MGDRDYYDDTSEAERAGTREHFLAVSRLEANVQRPALNVHLSIQKMIER